MAENTGPSWSLCSHSATEGCWRFWIFTFLVWTTETEEVCTCDLCEADCVGMRDLNDGYFRILSGPFGRLYSSRQCPLFRWMPPLATLTVRRILRGAACACRNLHQVFFFSVTLEFSICSTPSDPCPHTFVSPHTHTLSLSVSHGLFSLWLHLVWHISPRGLK